MHSVVSVKWSVETSYTRFFNLRLSAAGRDSVVIGGWEDYTGWWGIVAHYNVMTGDERYTVALDSPPEGKTTVLYNKQTCITVSNRKKIEFKPMNNLKQVVHSLDVDPHELSHMCALTSPPSRLLYCDRNTYKIHRVDCSTSPLTRQEIPIVHYGKKYVSDMCTSGDLLVLTRLNEGVFAYTLDGGQLKWKVSGKLPGVEHEIEARGVTADDQGHLLVCDTKNFCVQALSARDGAHLGVVVREGEEGVGMPFNVTWHQDTKSLVVAHFKDKVWHLSVFSSHQP